MRMEQKLQLKHGTTFEANYYGTAFDMKFTTTSNIGILFRKIYDGKTSRFIFADSDAPQKYINLKSQYIEVYNFLNNQESKEMTISATITNPTYGESSVAFTLDKIIIHK